MDSAPRVIEPVPQLSHGDADGSRIIEGDLQDMVSLRSQYQGSFDIALGDTPDSAARCAGDLVGGR